MKFGLVDDNRNIWPVRVMCAALPGALRAVFSGCGGDTI
jgi:hypothetical protein